MRVATDMFFLSDILHHGVRTLDNAAKERIRCQIERLTHFDPAEFLPNEVFLHICSFLPPRDLLTLSAVSRDWRLRSQDEKLWRGCFAREGWKLDKVKLAAFEKSAEEKKGKEIAASLTRKTSTGLRRRESRKRKTEEAFSGDEATKGKAKVADDAIEVDSAEDMDVMEGVEGSDATLENENSLEQLMPDAEEPPQPAYASMMDHTPRSQADFKLAPTLFQGPRNPHKVSWQYLYKQRRRLETNWEKGHYKTFQLPHREHPYEGHEECVYTIQHTPEYLVSGSRDHTIRIWDLSTYRLRGEPLIGHDQSVLCLQFDQRPEHDIIVSGGSDAYVIIWRFSTGEMLHKMTNAHTESVLNLRFDDRYIVTCSKDKTIKVWNRHAIARDSPLVPTHVANFFNNPTQPDLIKEYTLLTTLQGHHAAVNAVMIQENTIVSASGDRTIRAWDLHSSAPRKQYQGHQKGIACVQFDGRRVVSGSSDNTVRIFDADLQAEIACLSGHTNLVRTVQARFGDLDITTDQELQDEAKKADRGFYAALSRGMQPASVGRRGPRNAGSSRPEDMQSVGTRIPPGGGGSRWAKIVSGSYDESVIMWKRDIEGKWQIKLKLHQDEHLRLNRPPRRQQHIAGTGNGTPRVYPNLSHPANAQYAQQVLASAQRHLNQVHGALPPTGPQGGAPLLPNSQLTQISNANNSFNAQLQQLVQHHHQTQLAANNQRQNQQQQQPQQQQPGQPQTAVTTTTHGPTTTVTATAAHHHHQIPAGQHHHHHPHNQLNPQQLQQAQQAQITARQNSESNRVFKLQFDARRIVCCSQNRVIVGWDFANGEEGLERIGEWSLETP